jgi:ferritin-like metal-binding protein YciE
MADSNERDAKLVQYLSEAHGKERELETSLQAHIAMTTKAPYRKRLKEHLQETKRHARELERRIKKLGGGGLLTAQTAQTAVGKAMAVAKGPLHAIRGSGEQEKMLKNAKTEYFNEHEEIATYLAIEVLAERVGDKETAKLAKAIRREEERMAKFLEGQIKSLTRAVVSEQQLPRATSGGKSRSKAKSKSRSAAKPKSRSRAKPKSRSRAKAKPRSTAKAKRARKSARSGKS